MSVIELMRQELAGLDPVMLDIIDESSQHAGHAGASNGGHYRMTIVSSRFINKRTIERHRMVYDALRPLMLREIHALSIFAKTPDEP